MIQLLRLEFRDQPLDGAVLIGRLDIQPLIRNPVARQKFAQIIRLRRPPAAQHAQPFERRRVLREPVVQQFVDDRIQILFRRIPRLQQVMMQLDFVDRLNGRVGIGVGCQQYAAGVGIDLHGLGQELDAVHLRHAMIGQQQRYRIVALLQFPQQIERCRPGIRAQDTILLRVFAAKIALDGAQHIGIVVDRQ